MRSGVSERMCVRRDARKLDSLGVKFGVGEGLVVSLECGVTLADGGPWIEM
jgi:hypothetical protein